MTAKLEAAIAAAKEARKVSGAAFKGLTAAQKKVATATATLEKALQEQDQALEKAGVALTAQKAAAAALAKAQPAKAAKAAKPAKAAAVAAAPVAAAPAKPAKAAKTKA